MVRVSSDSQSTGLGSTFNLSDLPWPRRTIAFSVRRSQFTVGTWRFAVRAPRFPLVCQSNFPFAVRAPRFPLVCQSNFPFAVRAPRFPLVCQSNFPFAVRAPRFPVRSS